MRFQRGGNASGGGNGTEGGKGSGAAGGSSGGALTVIKIASQSPLSGGSAIQGESIKLGGQMALEERQAEFKELGFDLQYVPYDDQGDQKKAWPTPN